MTRLETTPSSYSFRIHLNPAWNYSPGITATAHRTARYTLNMTNLQRFLHSAELAGCFTHSHVPSGGLLLWVNHYRCHAASPHAKQHLHPGGPAAQGWAGLGWAGWRLLTPLPAAAPSRPSRGGQGSCLHLHRGANRLRRRAEGKEPRRAANPGEGCAARGRSRPSAGVPQAREAAANASPQPPSAGGPGGRAAPSSPRRAPRAERERRGGVEAAAGRGGLRRGEVAEG